MECGKMSKFKYTKDEIIQIIKSYHKKLNRVPARREIKEIANRGVVVFGSWNNAIQAAGFELNRSHEHRMYKRVRTIATDGHRCDSISEAIIDNWLSERKIPHMRDISYPSTNHKADWSLDHETFIEYFGLAKDSPRYDREIKIKKELCLKNNIALIAIYPSDLYPKNYLEHKLKNYI